MKRRKQLSSLLMAVFLFGLIGFQSYEAKADELPYIETQTAYKEQLILDPNFNKDLGSSPWDLLENGDKSDLSANIDGGTVNSTIIGDQRTFSLVSNPPFSGWTASQNPNFPYFPDTYVENNSGLCVSHYWNEGADQSVAVNWEQNVSMPVNMSDYIITTASISAEVNGSVYAPSFQPYSDGIEAGNDLGVNTTQYATGDYVRFYVLISDLPKNNVYEIASNQTSDLGQDWPLIDEMDDTLMIPVTEETLIFYLTSVLNEDNYNFTVTLGMRIWCEDNYPQDSDSWELLIIKSVNLTFTYEKKIDQFNSISLTQTSNAILSGDYDVPGSTVLIGIDEATLNFKYKMDQNWSDSSPNSEFRLYVNNSKLPETIKLTEGNSTWQNATAGGFDVSSYVFIDKNISLSLEVYLADEFLLDENSTIWIDDVFLNVSFTVTVRTDKIETDLKKVGSVSASSAWNDSFVVNLNYTEQNTSIGIIDAIDNFTIDWVDSYAIQEIGGGIYQLTCNNTNTISGQTYFIDISVDKFGYLQNSLQIEVNILERETEIEIFMEETNMTQSPVIELPILNQLNVTTRYFDSSYSIPIENATVSLYGIEDSSFIYSEIGFAHQFLIDTEKLGLGTHLISLVAEKFNYKEISTLLRITIVAIQTNLTTVGNIQSSTVTWDEQFFIDVNYVEFESGTDILNANFTANWIGGTYVIQELGSGIYRITCESNNTVSGLNYALEISVDDYLYVQNSLQVDVNVLNRETEIGIFMDETDVSLSPVIELPITSLLNVTALYYDLNKSVPIQNATASLYGILETNYIYTQEGDGHQFIIDTLEIGLGTHLISLVLENQNFDQISKLLRITVVPIQINGTIRDDIQSVSITPGSDYLLEIQLRDEFGDLVQDIEVNYTWEKGTGIFTFNETSGYYTALLSDIPEGVFDIIITAEKGPNYDFEEYRITISSTTKMSVGQIVLIYFLAGSVIALISGFGAYQLHYKYPPMVRDVRELRRKLRKGRKTKPILVESKAKIMDRIFQDQLKNSNIKSVKVKKIDKKLDKISRTDKDIKKITDKDSTKKAEKPVTEKKPHEEIKEKEKVEKVPDKKAEKKIAEQEKKLKEKAEREKIAQDKAAKKAVKKEKKLKEKTAEKEKAVMEKIAQEAASKAKKVKESPVKVGKKEEAKVKMSKISLPKKKGNKK